MVGYAELQVTSNFSFLRGGSHPDELVEAAAKAGLKALAVTDHNTFGGIVQAHGAAKEIGFRFLPSARLDFLDAMSVLCFPTDRSAYGRLSSLLTKGKRRASKGDCHLYAADLFEHGEGQLIGVVPPDIWTDEHRAHLVRLAGEFSGRCYLVAQHLYRGDDEARLAALDQIAYSVGVPMLATNDVHYHVKERRRLQDVLTCIREHCTIDEAGHRLFSNAERHIKTPAEMARLFTRYPDALERTLEVVERCTFSLNELRYEYPVDPVPEGQTPQSQLARLAWEGAAQRYPQRIPDKIQTAINYELKLIDQLGYAPYFLTVHDIVRFARGEGILCQGRGSAANSAVCYCIGITSVDPSKIDLLFERFISAERNEPPDIDVDFGHERREEVIQYIYRKYGRARAALTANTVKYRTKGAIADVGKAMGLSRDMTRSLAAMVWGYGIENLTEDQVRQRGLNPKDRRIRLVIELVGELRGFPRHRSQHPGGFVITRTPLHEVVPIENAAMADRWVIEWNKEDIDELGILKIDVLALGMLTAISKGFDFIAEHYGKRFDLATVPPDDPAVYDMLCKADSVGVFQVESRAQMNMLPRLKPRCFYDLVIETAIVRPGPIQGDMVHPYLKRRDNKEAVEYPSEELREVLGRTLGVPLFQEQAMKIAIVAAGFTPSEADQLRRAMAAFRRAGTIQRFGEKLIAGMTARGYTPEFAERCFKQIEGFGEYGFPESHAASFALLVYVSAWLKCHYPAAFTAALLNSLPMGFYAPAQLVRDVREHQVEARAPDINHSLWDCTLEPALTEGLALRLGLRLVKGAHESEIVRLIEHRGNGYMSLSALWRRSGVQPKTLERLADADAYRSLRLTRRQALWTIQSLAPKPLPLFAAAGEEEMPEDDSSSLPLMTLPEEVSEDYRTLSLSLKAHPLSFMRSVFDEEGVVPNSRLAELKPDRYVTVAGLVLIRQRPGTASGVIFMTIEDETGVANLVVWTDVFERYRHAVLSGQMIVVRGRLQREGDVIHVVASGIYDHTPRLRALVYPPPNGDGFGSRSRDFH